MVEMRQLTEADFPAVFETFLQDDDPLATRTDWRRFFALPWQIENDCRGYGLFDQGRLVGMLGMLLSERTIDGRPERFCNLHSWFVDESYRGYSLMLMRPALRLTDHTLTDLTPTPPVRQLSYRMGFQPMDASLLLLLPLPGLSSRVPGDYEFTDSPTVIERIVSDADRRIFQSHRWGHFQHLLVHGEGGYCYVVYSRVTRHWLSYAYAQYISDPALFARLHDRFRNELRHRGDAGYVAVDARRFPQQSFPRSMIVRNRTGHLMKSNRVQPQDIDPLYTEVSLLNLTTYPSLRSWMARKPGADGRSQAKPAPQKSAASS